MKMTHFNLKSSPLCCIALTTFLVWFGSPVLAQTGMATAQGPSGLTVLVSEIMVDGGFAELSDATEELIVPFKGRRSSVEELQALAQTLELLYQQAGYFLVRVTIPPQEVKNGDTFRLLVIDGYLEAVDLQGVPARLRSQLEALLKPIVNQPRLKMADFEHVLMVARQMPGLSIHTTLVSGDDVGATVLVVEGDWIRYSGSLSLNKRLSDPETGWNGALHMQLNQPLGRGEQFGAQLSGTPSSLLSPWNAESLTFGGNIRWPLGNAGTSLHLNYSASHTDTPSPHWLIPATRSDFQRISLEVNKPLWLSRTGEFRVSGTLDATDQSLAAPDFEATLHQDRLRVLRLNGNSRRESTSGSRLSLSVQLSQGLTVLGARTVENVQKSNIPFSRFDAVPTFRKVSGTASWRWPFTSRFTLTSTLHGQYAFKGPLPTTELFSLSGGNALPSLALGIGANDHGWTLREEVESRLSLLNGKLPLLLYGYVAGGSAASEIRGLSRLGAAGGVGIRSDMGRARFSFEYGRGRAQAVSDEALVASVEVVF